MQTLRASVLSVGIEPGLAVDDTARLATALEGLLLDPVRRAKVGAAGRARAGRQFGIGPMMDAYEALYTGR